MGRASLCFCVRWQGKFRESARTTGARGPGVACAREVIALSWRGLSFGAWYVGVGRSV